MRLDLFSQGDSVLLLGEGNFSFTKGLFTNNLPIKITATCFDNGVKYKGQLENIQFLTKNKIPVYFDVDATKLHEHPILGSQLYSKIIFNFPHVGGKMKIQLNRQLIRKVCESSSHLLHSGGLLIISLCNGQGGTPADNPQRKWDDSWQVAEMAGYGCFCLISVEPFVFDNYQEYSCTGYRSQDSHFNLKGALVHIFEKRVKPSRIISDELAIKRLSLVPLYGSMEILVPFHYSDLYSKNPLQRSKSSVCFFKSLLLKHLEKSQCRKNLKIINNERIPMAVESLKGVTCKYNGKYQKLRSSAVQVMYDIINEFNCCCTEENVMFFPGIFFNSLLGQDFEMTPPIMFQFVLLGKNVSEYFKKFLNDLVSLFQIHGAELYCREIFPNTDSGDVVQNPSSQEIIDFMNENSYSNCTRAVEWHCTKSKGTGNILGHELHFGDGNIKLEALIIYVDKFIELFFCTNTWKETWSEDSFVFFHSGTSPVLKQGVLYPLCYKFDITLKYDTEKNVSDDDVYEILRLSAIDMIKEVEMINKYDSGMGWSSKCFRITYQSQNDPLNRSLALNVHTQFISKMITLALPVTIK